MLLRAKKARATQPLVVLGRLGAYHSFFRALFYEKTFRVGVVAIATFLLTSAHAQTVANLNFETWANRSNSVSGGVEAPTNWQTSDDIISGTLSLPIPTSTATVSKTVDAHGGTYAARLETKSYTLVGQTQTVPGGAGARCPLHRFWQPI